MLGDGGVEEDENEKVVWTDLEESSNVAEFIFSFSQAITSENCRQGKDF